ncbi:MAG: tetratricopeptide repeat protein [Planctomycetota bacterium]
MQIDGLSGLGMTRVSGVVRPATAALLGALWLWAPAPAEGQVSAQVAAQQDGRALDASPAVGGRVNGRVETPDFRARNNLVTGNVSGGFGFRGDVGYTAPGDFRGSIGSDDLFDFRAESIRSAPNLVGRFNGIRATSPGQIQVFNSASDPTVNTFGSPLRAEFGRADRRGLFGADLGGVFQLERSSSTGSFGQVRLDRGAGAFAPVDGLLEGSSPLLGASLAGRSLEADLAVRGRVGALPSDDEMQASLDGREPAVEYGIDPGRAGGEAQGRRIEDVGLPGEDEAGAALLPGAGDRPGRVEAPGAGMLLGRQLTQSALEARRRAAAEELAEQSAALSGGDAEPQADGAGAGSTAGTIERRDRLTADAARTSIFAALRGKTDQQIENDPYLSLLRDLETGGEAGSGAGTGSALTPGTSGLSDASSDQLQAARDARREARQRLLGEDAEEQELEASAAEGESEVARLLAELDYDRPAVASLAPVESGLPVDEYVRRGEARMKAGNFLQAEATFREALMEDPEHVLAQAGLAHARLGAGMVRSSAGTLRRLFAEHPEVIALRYDGALLPPPERMRWLQRELTRMIDNQTAASEAGLLLAYMGYQTGWPNVVRFGLDTAESSAAGDPLLPVLRRIWLSPEGDAAK